MTRQQRQKAEDASVVRAAVEAFIDNPCTLSLQQTRDLLMELCVDLGFCLSPKDHEAVEADPPTDPLAFAELVMKLEGVGSGDSEMLAPILERVLRTFEGVTRKKAAPSQSFG